MEDIDNYYNEDNDDKSIPNDGKEELDISPLDWNDI